MPSYMPCSQVGKERPSDAQDRLFFFPSRARGEVPANPLLFRGLGIRAAECVA